MIVIMSEESDLMTNHVINWLSHFQVPFVRINKSTSINLEKFEIDASKVHFSLIIHNPDTPPIQIDSTEIKAFWHRRGELHITYPFIEAVKNVEDKKIAQRLNFYLGLEGRRIKEVILSQLVRYPSIGNYHNSEVNKIDNLIVAQEVGFDIPQTLITNQKEWLQEFIEKTPAITKAMFIGALPLEGISFGAGTHSIYKENIEALAKNSFPSFVQEQLDKAYELRIFYLHGNCYASAIFSQNDAQTSVDFRNYNKQKPNRTPPYKLPKTVEDKIQAFMKKTNQNSGSIDLVVTKDKRYVFLEVNPIGQFAQVSYPCNYYLDKKVAEYLAHA